MKKMLGLSALVFAFGLCVACGGSKGGGSTGSGGSGSSGTSGSGTTTSGSGSTSGGSTSTSGSSGSASGGSCNGDFSINQDPFTCSDCGLGQACDGNPPKNCADGTYLVRGDGSCVCAAMCSSFQGGPQPGDACYQAGWHCEDVTAQNGNEAKLCVKDDWMLCHASGGSSSSSSSGGSSSSSGSGSSSSGGDCGAQGASCSFDSECCSQSCNADTMQCN